MAFDFENEHAFNEILKKLWEDYFSRLSSNNKVVRLPHWTAFLASLRDIPAVLSHEVDQEGLQQELLQLQNTVKKLTIDNQAYKDTLDSIEQMSKSADESNDDVLPPLLRGVSLKDIIPGLPHRDKFHRELSNSSTKSVESSNSPSYSRILLSQSSVAEIPTEADEETEGDLQADLTRMISLPEAYNKAKLLGAWTDS